MSSRAGLLALLSLTLLCALPPSARPQNRSGDESRDDSSVDEELVVRGRRLSDFRSALEIARVRVYDLFNDLNSDDAFDVHC